MSNIQKTEVIKKGLVARQKQINSIMGDKVKANKFIATALSVASDYKLQNCNPDSVLDACVSIAQAGLDISPALSHAYIVPFKSSAQVIISAKGLTALLARTGWKIKSYIVKENDFFKYEVDGFTEKVFYQKDLDSSSNFKYAVAMAKSSDGELFVEIMNARDIDKHRRASSNQKGEASGVWKDWSDEMATKTVIKKLAKKLPIGEEIANAIYLDDKESIKSDNSISDIKKADSDIQDMNAINEVVDEVTGEITSSDGDIIEIDID